MALIESTMLELKTPLPHFQLVEVVNQRTVDTQQLQNKPVLVAFICNHCPYVVHILNQFEKKLNTFVKKGIEVICISSNDITTHPADAPDKMAILANDHHFQFPYCFDQSQQIAKAFNAQCTPDLFLFDEQHQLYYRGRFDSATPGNHQVVTGSDLQNAVDALLKKQAPPHPQHPSMGCSIKWKT